MKGLEAVAFVSLVIVMMTVSILTTLVNLTIIYKLRLFPEFELISLIGDNVVFHSNVDLDAIHLSNAQIKGVSSISGNLVVESGTSAININEEGIQIASDNGFEVRSKDTSKLLFPIDFGSLSMPPIPSLSLPGGAKDVHKIRSPTNEDLVVTAKERIKIRGNQGIDLESRSIEAHASHIFLASVNASIILEANEGIAFRIKSINQVLSDRHSNQQKQLQYKLCVCGKSGRIFQMKLNHETDGCGDVRFPESPNPCI